MPTPYSPPKLTPRIQAAVDNREFGFPMPYQKPLYRTDEVAETIGRERKYVYALADDARLEAHLDSAVGERKSGRFTRRSVLLYLTETANYDPAYLVIRMEALLKSLNRPALIRLINTATKRLNTIVE